MTFLTFLDIFTVVIQVQELEEEREAVTLDDLLVNKYMYCMFNIFFILFFNIFYYIFQYYLFIDVIYMTLYM